MTSNQHVKPVWLSGAVSGTFRRCDAVGDDAVGTMGRQEQPFADRNLTRKSTGENTSAIPESRLELVLVIAINVVLWTIAVIEIMGAVQMTAPLIGNPVA
ncbi:MAG: hypothetical protein ABWY35_07355 [Pseudorhodoplanes sp.]